MKNVNKTKKKSFLFRMVTMMMAVFTLAIVMALPVSASASAAEAPAAGSTVEITQLTAVADNSNATVMYAANNIAPKIVLAATKLDEQKNGDDQFKSVVEFFVKWIKRVGLLVAFVGGVMFALAIKNNDAEQKQAGLLTLVAGFVVAALCQAVDMFGIFD